MQLDMLSTASKKSSSKQKLEEKAALEIIQSGMAFLTTRVK